MKMAGVKSGVLW